jgi:hypothetical protein
MYTVLIVFNLSGASGSINSQWLFSASSQPARGHTKRKALFLVLKLTYVYGFNRFQFIVLRNAQQPLILVL